LKVIKERIIGKVKDRGEAKKPQGFLNREQRRKYGISVVNDQLKNRNVAMANNQCGFGLIHHAPGLHHFSLVVTQTLRSPGSS